MAIRDIAREEINAAEAQAKADYNTAMGTAANVYVQRLSERDPADRKYYGQDIVVSAPDLSPDASDDGEFALGDFFAIGPGSFNKAYEVASVEDFEDVWNQFVSGAGIDRLGVETNWWPGMHAERPLSLAMADYAGWYTPGEDRPESWAPRDRFHTFTDTETDQSIQLWTRYDPSRAGQQYMAMGGKERERYATMMVNAGLLPKEFKGLGDFTPEAAAAFSEALSWANYWGQPLDDALVHMGGLYKKLGGGGGGGRGGGGGPQVKLEIPDYETLVAEAKELIQAKVGNRDVKEWELALVADEFQRQYGRWADATKARMIGGNGTYEIPDPVALTETFVEDKYSDEIGRLEDIGDQRQMNQLLVGAATRGTQMMGGLGGVR